MRQTTLLNQNDVANMLGLKPRTLEDYRVRGVGPRFVRISSRCIRYRLDDVQAWITAQVVSSTSEPVWNMQAA
jgi:predicted DNA-binding transcriptional regulator AlpA